MESTAMPVAVIGMGCRFPGGANSPEELWELLAVGKDTWTPVPPSRWNEEAFFHSDPDMQGMYNHRGGHFLEQDVAEFDGGFFGLAPTECEAMDPQQRIQLEVAYEALESAGIRVGELKGSETGVYVATFCSDYNLIQHKDINDITRYHTTGNGTAIIANRISYLLDLRGPSLTLDTGCSGSLVAVHQACQSLRLGECRMALAGGVNLMLSPDQMTTMSLMRCWNEDGKCYSFDDRGTGYGRGEGAAMVVLKRLDDAIKDGDPIRAIIRNSGINQDGKTNGIMVPKSEAQEKLIRSVYHAAGLNPRDTTFVEAHGTGTAVGDPLEMAAIRSAFRSNTQDEPLLIGTIKPNIGHLESASGIAGLIKGVLMLEQGQILPTIGIKSLKPNLGLEDSGIEIPESLRPWPEGRIRRVSVNSFGYGGTNAHAILEEFQHLECAKIPNGVDNKVSEQRLLQILPFSGATQSAVLSLINRFRKWATNNVSGAADELHDLAYTLSKHRSVMQHRVAINVTSSREIARSLDSDTLVPIKSATGSRSIFVFTGQGAQWYAMGRELIEIQSSFRISLEKSDQYLKMLGSEWSLLEELSKDEDDSRINESDVSQPATSALQIALVDLLDDLGVRPNVVVGHSSGEIAAAYAAGALDQKSALEISYYRGRLRRAPGGSKGAMLAVGLGEKAATRYLSMGRNGKAVIACANSPMSSTISGDDEAIAEIEEALKNDGIFVRRLMVDQAYHSHHMLDVADQYIHDLNNLISKATKRSVVLVSSVTGQEKSFDFGPDYWAMNLVSPVQFSDAMSHALGLGIEDGQKPPQQIIIEIGPHNALAGPIRQLCANMPQVSLLTVLQRGRNAIQTFTDLAVSLFEKGSSIDITLLNSLLWSKRVPKVLTGLPTYPWNHSVKHWHESRQSKDHRFRKFPYHDLVGIQSPTANDTAPVWRNFLSLSRLPWLRDHVIDGEIIFPASGFICMAVEALRQTAESKGLLNKITRYQLKSINFVAPVIIPESGKPVELQLTFLALDGSDWNDFRITSIPSNGPTIEHCRGMAMYRHSVHDLERDYNQAVLSSPTQIVNGTNNTSEERIDVDQFYRKLKAIGNNYGPDFATLMDLRIHGAHARSTIRIPDVAERMPYRRQSPHLIHPATLDALLHPSIALFNSTYDGESIVTASIDNLSIYPSMQSSAGNPINFSTQLCDVWAQTCLTNITAFDDTEDHSGQPALSVQGLGLRALVKAAEHKYKGIHSRRDMCYQLKWEPDVDFISSIDIDPPLEEIHRQGQIQAAKLRMLNQASSIYISRCLSKLKSTAEEGENISDSHRRLFGWMNEFWQGEDCKSLVSEIAPIEVDSFLKETASLGVEGEVLSQIGENLASILQQNLDPLSLITEKDLLWRLYEDDASARCYTFVSKYLEALCFKKPNMTILEIGAGTGSATEPILESLSSDSTFHFESYDFTDLSTAFFARAQQRLHKWKDALCFRKLDVQKDATEQGFEEGSFDLVLASNVLHVANSIPTALSQLRKLLRPGGRIVMIETTRNVPFYNTILGTLPGWWAGLEDGRTDGPFLSEEQWDKTLQKTGFNGTDIVVKDFEGPAHRCSMIVSNPATPGSVSPETQNSMEILLCPSWEIHGPSFTAKLCSTLNRSFGPVHTKNLTSANISGERVYLVLDDGSMPVLTTSDPKVFQAVTNLVSNASWVFWISAQEDAKFLLNPAKNLITGFVRSARAENPGTNIVTLDLQDALREEHTLRHFCNTIHNLVTKALEAHSRGSPGDMDYIYKNGQVFIPRVIPDSGSSLAVAKGMNRSPKEFQDYHQEGRTLRLATDKALFIDNMEFKEDETVQNHSDATELIDIQVFAWGINFKDILIAGGHVRKKLAMAGEFSGIVVNVGTDFQQKYSIGDRVCGFGATPYASRIRVHGDTVARLPESISFNIGAAIPVAYATAYHSLINVARLTRGQTVLIHSAAGALGQAAVDIANWIGATVFCTVGTKAKIDFLVSKKMIVKGHIFSSRTESFKDAILSRTEGKGVDVVLNTLSGQLLHASMECVAAFGTFLELGKTDAHSGTRISMAPFDSSLTVASIDMAMIHRHKPGMAGELVSKVLSMLENKQLPMPESPDVFPIDKIQQSFRLMQDRTHMGKIVLECGPESKVEAPPRRFNMRYDNNSTYIIAGGLGGVGLEIARYLTKNGARHLVLLGRRQLTMTQEDEIKRSIPVLGADIRILSCDITILSELQERLLNLLQGMPPVQGLFQSAMILRDRIVSEMTLEEFSSCVAPKVEGTQNLLRVLSKQPLEWVVLLSSVVGGLVGTVAEANYAAGNAYLSGLARCQQDQKPRIIALAPGVIDDVGVLSSDDRVKQILQRQGFPAVKVGEIIALIDHAIGEEARNLGKNEIISGFDYASLKESGNQRALDNPIFSHVLRNGAIRAGSLTDAQVPAAERSIADASSIEEAENIVTEALVRKIGTLIAADEETLDPTQSLAELGVDSLVVVEVKNWIGQTFRVKVQNAEVSDAINLTALAKSIASRSPLMVQSQPPKETENSNGVRTNGNVNGSTKLNGEHKNQPDDHHQELPKQPLPDLEASLKLWSEAVKPVLGDQDYIKALKLSQKFREPGGIGQKLQARLAALANDPNVDNWQEDLYTRNYFLKVRDPLMPQWNFFATHPFEGGMHSQSQRAAIICNACRVFKDSLEAGDLETDLLNEQKMEANQYKYFFNCTREPRRGEDVMQKYPGNEYLVAFRKGHAFRIPLGLSFTEMRDVFQYIIDSSVGPESWVGVLTTNDRDYWADGRELLQRVSPENAAKLHTIEAAAFIIYLDDAEPQSARERGNQFLQNGFNRWCDKTIQFPICSNGWSATIGEHSMMDGYTVRRLNNFVMESIRTHQAENTQCNGFQPESFVESFVFDTTDEIEQRIETARQCLHERTSVSELTTFELSIINESFFRKHKVPPKSGVQLAIHLLARKFFGFSPIGHETVSLGHFLKGRVDLSHTLWPSMKKFCDVVSQPDVTADKLRPLLLEAAKSHANNLMRCSNGHGIDRHLLCLEWSMQPGEEVPELFTSEIYKSSKPRLLVTDCLDSGVRECGAMPSHSSGLWVHFDFHGENVRFSIWGPVGQTDQLEELMKDSALQLRDILES